MRPFTKDEVDGIFNKYKILLGVEEQREDKFRHMDAKSIYEGACKAFNLTMDQQGNFHRIK